MIKHLILLFFSLAALNLFAQYTICDCCTYAPLEFRDDFENLFPPEIIQKNHIHELTIYTTSKRESKNSWDTILKTVDYEFKEMAFQFNEDGYVMSQTLFGDFGKPHIIYEYTRNKKNHILAKNFYYLDSLGTKYDFMQQKWIYTQAKGRIVKVKELGPKFVKMPDAKSNYSSYKYNKLGRPIEEVQQYYFGENNISYYKSEIVYNDSMDSSLTTTKRKDLLHSSTQIAYNRNNQPTNEKYFDGETGTLLQEKIWNYDPNNRLVRYQVISTGMGTECPDGGSFTDVYTYSFLNLIETITHSYTNVTCVLRFEYK